MTSCSNHFNAQFTDLHPGTKHFHASDALLSLCDYCQPRMILFIFLHILLRSWSLHQIQQSPKPTIMHFPIQPVAVLACLLVLVTATTTLTHHSPTTLSTLLSRSITNKDQDPTPTDVTTAAKKPCTICIDKLNTCHNVSNTTPLLHVEPYSRTDIRRERRTGNTAAMSSA